MQVRHDTSMLQRAVEVAADRAAIPVHDSAAQNHRVRLLAEAQNHRTRLLAEARRLLAVGVTIAIAAIGIGIGVGLGFSWAGTKAQGPSDTARIRAAVGRVESGLVPGEATGGAEPTLDFSIFRTAQVRLFDRRWSINAGHDFFSSEDESWATAFCYTFIESDGVRMRLELATRFAPGSESISPPQTPQTLRAFDLTAEQVKRLASHCPWLESEAL